MIFIDNSSQICLLCLSCTPGTAFLQVKCAAVEGIASKKEFSLFCWQNGLMVVENELQPSFKTVSLKWPSNNTKGCFNYFLFLLFTNCISLHWGLNTTCIFSLLLHIILTIKPWGMLDMRPYDCPGVTQQTSIAEQEFEHGSPKS